MEHNEHFATDYWSQVYTGHWQNDKQHGKGKLLYNNGDSYKGNFRFGVRSGYGIYQQGSKVFSGFWENDLKNGEFMVFSSKTGEAFEVEYRNDKHVDFILINPFMGQKLDFESREEFAKYQLPFLGPGQSDSALTEREKYMLRTLYQLDRLFKIKSLRSNEKEKSETQKITDEDQKRNPSDLDGEAKDKEQSIGKILNIIRILISQISNIIKNIFS